MVRIAAATADVASLARSGAMCTSTAPPEPGRYAGPIAACSRSRWARAPRWARGPVQPAPGPRTDSVVGPSPVAARPVAAGSSPVAVGSSPRLIESHRLAGSGNAGEGEGEGEG